MELALANHTVSLYKRQRIEIATAALSHDWLLNALGYKRFEGKWNNKFGKAILNYRLLLQSRTLL